MTTSQFPGETAPPAPRPWRWPRRIGLFAVAVLAFFGPWPVDNRTYRGTAGERRTLDRLASLPAPPPSGPIRVGLAEVDLTPASPVPLAGFIGQTGTPYEGVDSACLARALTIASSAKPVTILTADLLLINAEMARVVVDRAGLEAEDVVFTASHTHGAPGRWGRHPLEQLTAGKFDPAVFATLADRLADVVRRSRANLVPAEMATVQAHPAGRQKNRLSPGEPTHDALSAIVFRPVAATEGTPPMAILAVFGAHATIVRTVPPRLSADYPGALVAALKEKTGAGMVLFASGAVGDASPIRPPGVASTPKAARMVGAALADDLLEALSAAKFSAEVVVDRLRLDVDLPPVRLPFFSSWLRFSPAATWWISDRTTHLDSLRVGPAVLVGFPGDEAGHLAEALTRRVEPTGLTPIVTSFNGDYRGYFTSASTFFINSCYETRWMSFHGPWLGEYLGDVAARMVERTDGRPANPGERESDVFNAEVIPRVLTLTLLVLAAIATAIRGRRAPTTRGFGAKMFVFVGIALAVASILSPNSIDWSRIGLDAPLRLVGFGVGAFAISGIWNEDRPTHLTDTFFLLGVAFQSACWPIALAALACPIVRPIPASAGAHQS